MPSAASFPHLIAKNEICKKKIKNIAKALRTVNQTPKTPGRPGPTGLLSHTFQAPIRSRNNSDTHRVNSQNLGPTPISTPVTTPRLEQENPVQEEGHRPRDVESGIPNSAKATPIAFNHRTPLNGSAPDSSTAWDSGAVTNYGSIISSPPNQNPPFRPPSLELPDPALPPDEESFARHNRAWRHSHQNPYVTPQFPQTTNNSAHPYEVGVTHTPPKATSSLLPRHRRLFQPRRTASNPAGPDHADRPRLVRRIFSAAGTETPLIGDVPLAGYKEFETRQAEFEKFLDSELDKIESFYKMKEQQASERLIVLRQQLHEMRDRRVEEVRVLQQARERQKQEQEQLRAEGGDGAINTLTNAGNHLGPVLDWRHPIDSVRDAGHRVGKNSKALVKMGPVEQHHNSTNVQTQLDRQDFQRRPTHADDVPYRTAKKKLRLALQEFYRGLELLKSYALVNRTAFRKINKKYDKVVKARPTGRFMTEKVNKAWFVQSEVLEGLIVAVEDLYARYFERGNHKVAVGKLRSKHNRTSDHTGSVFRNGLLIAAGAVFGVQGLVYGAEHLFDANPVIRINTSYLLQVSRVPTEGKKEEVEVLTGVQIYGGYFLGLLLVLLFCLDCLIWTRAKINYVFIFEFDTRHNLDWRQLSEFRLLLAGIYPVEFRDFFLGDMYCSQTYAMGVSDTPQRSQATWDLAMDWSLGNPYAQNPFLREHLGYKRPSAYYTAMALDPILRFNWIFYVIFTNSLQHSALLSFMVSLSEVLRRAMWTLFRVENEHCTNVGRFRASRDVPLPYDIPSPTPSIVEESRDQFTAHHDGTTSGDFQPTPSSMASGAQVASDHTQPPSGSLRRRQASSPATAPSPVPRGIARVGTIMTQAHAQDFERKRRPGGTPLERQATYEDRHRGKTAEPEGVDSESEDDEAERDESHEEETLNVHDILERRRSAVGGG
ncbi:MAG: hypothetical protein Q9207_006801 [Kuettlingeria erythrocarpa]